MSNLKKKKSYLKVKIVLKIEQDINRMESFRLKCITLFFFGF